MAHFLKKLSYCPSWTGSIFLAFHKHNRLGDVPLGQILDFVSYYWWAQCLNYVDVVLNFRNFTELGQRDQDTLLRRDTGLYIQLQVASCLVFSGSTQINLRRLELIKRILKQNSDISQYIKVFKYPYSGWFNLTKINKCHNKYNCWSELVF